MDKPILLWFRRDLRLSDHAALTAALQSGAPIIPVFIWAPEEEKPWQPGAASRWWLHHSLEALDKSLRHMGSRLIVRSGPSLATLRFLLKETGASGVVWSRVYEPALIQRDTEVKQALRNDGFTAESHNALLLFEPWEIRNQAGKPFQVFTPFWKNCLNQPEPAPPLREPKKIPVPPHWPESLRVAQLQLLPDLDWADGFGKIWSPGEKGAQVRLDQFAAERVDMYADERNRPDHEGTSRLSPHLHFGEISPRQIWHTIQRASLQSHRHGGFHGSEIYLKEIGWREFAHHLLFHFPHTPEQPLHPEFAKFPWEKNTKGLKAWQQGRTGYGLVDAGMRELWSTGWMHNRVRMVAASFLIKDLLISWQEGSRWFWDTLVDADLANNTLGWQWTAGCGADAAPYYRVFNPELQAQKFDPQGSYVKRWVQSEAPRIVEHEKARQKALMLFDGLKKRTTKEAKA